MSGSPRVLVTGASGFVGRSLCAELLRRGAAVRAGVRGSATAAPPGCEPVVLGDLSEARDLGPAVSGIDAVIHLAAKVHDPRSTSDDAYAPLNVRATERLARAAAAAGVRRFVFASSIKVNGERTAPGEAFRSGDAPRPQDAYARSKWRAEQVLAAIPGLDVCIVRPPLVYGPGVGANFLRLVRAVERRLPLPLASVRNRRSLIYVRNLAELLALCVTHPAAAGRTLLAADGEDVSTPQLVELVAQALGVKPRLLPCPAPLLRIAGAACGRHAEIGRLLDSLVVDAGECRDVLGWRPGSSLREGIAETVRAYRARYP